MIVDRPSAGSWKETSARAEQENEVAARDTGGRENVTDAEVRMVGTWRPSGTEAMSICALGKMRQAIVVGAEPRDRKPKFCEVVHTCM